VEAASKEEDAKAKSDKDESEQIITTDNKDDKKSESYEPQDEEGANPPLFMKIEKDRCVNLMFNTALQILKDF